MSEFANSVYTGRMFEAQINMDPHLFYELDGGHAIFRHPITQRVVLTVGDRIPLSCMFEGYWMLVHGERVGYIFSSQFQTMNSGGYIVAYMEAKRGLATSSETLLKTDDLVIFNFPNKGTLIVSPKIGDETITIFEEQ